MSEEIKLCPFCGNEAMIEIGDNRIIVSCRGFGCYARRDCHSNNKQEAINKWNERPDNWISVKERLPEDYTKPYVIRHYNGFMEVARFDGTDWYSISPRFTMIDEKLSKEGQPDFWMLPEPPKN